MEDADRSSWYGNGLEACKHDKDDRKSSCWHALVCSSRLQVWNSMPTMPTQQEDHHRWNLIESCWLSHCVKVGCSLRCRLLARAYYFMSATQLGVTKNKILCVGVTRWVDHWQQPCQCFWAPCPSQDAHLLHDRYMRAPRAHVALLNHCRLQPTN